MDKATIRLARSIIDIGLHALKDIDELLISELREQGEWWPTGDGHQSMLGQYEDTNEAIRENSYRTPAGVGMKPDEIDFLIPDSYQPAHNSAVVTGVTGVTGDKHA